MTRAEAFTAGMIACKECRGHGADPLSDNVNWQPCRTCGGKGYVEPKRVTAEWPILPYPNWTAA